MPHLRRPWRDRLRALLLAALFVAGGLGLPVLDGALYHHAAHPLLDVPHIEGATAACHVERCLLDLAVATVATVPPLTVSLRVTPSVLVPPPPQATGLRYTLAAGLLPPSRASPARPA